MSSTGSTPRRIVVGVDGSEGSKLALRWARRVARAEDARIDVIGVRNIPITYGRGVVTPPEPSRADLQKALVETVDEVFGSHRPNALELRVVDGYPAQVLVEQSATAVMLIVGSRGHGGFMGVLLGSVSARVAEQAKCPVLVVHGSAIPA